ncbi:DUF4276 family protein [Glycomyces buryatensis]|nr:DUF4276 family protein [Glycomyces buryatensis]
MTVPVIAPIVEGHGEREAVQALLARLLPWLDDQRYVHVHPPNRKPRDLLLKSHGLAAALREAMTLRPLPSGVLIMIDADDECPMTLAEHLRDLAKVVHPDAPSFVVIPNREFEAWFLAAASSFAGKFGLPEDLRPPPDPEAIRDAKGWFTKRMPRGRPYKPAVHQKQFAKLLDLDAARGSSRSFRKLCSDLERILT